MNPLVNPGRGRCPQRLRTLTTPSHTLQEYLGRVLQVLHLQVLSIRDFWCDADIWAVKVERIPLGVTLYFWEVNSSMGDVVFPGDVSHRGTRCIFVRPDYNWRSTLIWLESRPIKELLEKIAHNRLSISRDAYCLYLPEETSSHLWTIDKPLLKRVHSIRNRPIIANYHARSYTSMKQYRPLLSTRAIITTLYNTQRIQYYSTRTMPLRRS